MTNNTTLEVSKDGKSFTIKGTLNDRPIPSSTGETEALVTVRNEASGVTHSDGRQIKLSLNIYVKPPKA